MTYERTLHEVDTSLLLAAQHYACGNHIVGPLQLAEVFRGLSERVDPRSRPDIEKMIRRLEREAAEAERKLHER